MLRVMVSVVSIAVLLAAGGCSAGNEAADVENESLLVGDISIRMADKSSREVPVVGT